MHALLFEVRIGLNWKSQLKFLKVLVVWSVITLALIDDGFQTHKCIYNIAYAYYKLGKLRQSRLFCERLLKLDPLNQQAQDLHQQLDSIVQQSIERQEGLWLEGLLGLGITTAIVGAAAVILYKSFGKKWCLFVLKWGWWRSLAAIRGPQWEKDGICSIPHIDSISLNISFLYIKIIRSVWNSIFQYFVY